MWQPNFQASIDTHTVPLLWKLNTYNHYLNSNVQKNIKIRLVALTLVIMKCVERMLFQYVVSTVKDKLPCQFAYKQVCSTEYGHTLV